MKKSIYGTFLGAACAAMFSTGHAESPDAAQSAAATRIAVTTCTTCHGPKGVSISPKFPVLAGQHASYLAAQMHNFKSQTRGDPDALGYMWGMAATLDDDTIQGLADYYAHQTPPPAHPSHSAEVARGEAIYLHGEPDAGIPACATCHGAKAEGTDTFPRLAGQQPQYLVKQLRSFSSNLRNVAVMHGVAQGLKEAQMEDVAEYLRTLGP